MPINLLNGLVSYWKLDEAAGNAADAVGGNTLIKYGGLTYGAGKIGNCAIYDWVDSNLGIQSDVANLSFAGDFTLACWFWVDPAADVNASFWLIGKLFSTAHMEYSLTFSRHGEDAIYLFASSSDGANPPTASAHSQLGLSLGAWHFVRAWAAAPHIYVQVDNGTIYESADEVAPYDGSNVFNIGSVTNTHAYWHGKVDEVGVWSRALTTAEATLLYNNGHGLTHPFTGPFYGPTYWLSPVVLQPGLGEVDTYLSGAQHTTPYGSGAALIVDTITAIANALLKFDLSGIPPTAVFTSATLQLWIDTGSTYNSGTNSDWTLRRILPGNSGWTGAGATYDHAVEDTVEWAGSAGCNTEGVDFSATPMATATVANPTPASVTFTFTDMAELAAMVANNCGFRMYAAAGLRQQLYIRSSEYGVLTEQPKLTIEFTVPEPPEPPEPPVTEINTAHVGWAETVDALTGRRKPCCCGGCGTYNPIHPVVI